MSHSAAAAGAATALAKEAMPIPARKPSSARRIAASRANGRLSRGPKSSPGKLNSAAANRKHGFYTQVALPEINPHFLAGMLASHNPQSPYQHSLVLTMTNALWLEQNIQTLQTQQLKAAIERIDDPNLTPPVRAALAFRNLSAESNSLEVALRLEARYGRQHHRAFIALQKSCKMRNLMIDPNPISEQQTKMCEMTIEPNPEIEHNVARFRSVTEHTATPGAVLAWPRRTQFQTPRPQPGLGCPRCATRPD